MDIIDKSEIPPVDYAIINGSGTWGIEFPEDIEEEGVIVLRKNMVFDTPYGQTVAFKLIRIMAGADNEITKDLLVIPMHGWRYGEESEVSRVQCTDQVFWVLKQAGVKKIIGESSCGALNQLLEPYDVVIPSDFIEDRVRRGTKFTADHRMANIFCPNIRATLIDEAEKNFHRVMRRGIYIVFEGPRLETPAEIQRMRQWGGDIVAQSLTPEIYYARGIGACYGSIHIVSNYAEGVNSSWDISDMVKLYRSCGPSMGKTILRAMKHIDLDGGCECTRHKRANNIFELVVQG